MIIVIGCFLVSFFFAAVGVVRAAARKRAEAARIAAQEAEKRQKAEQARRKALQAAENRAAAQAARQQQADARARERERKRAEKDAAQVARYEEQQRKRSEKIEAARMLAEYNERALKAARELKALESSQKRPETISEVKPAPAPAAEAPAPDPAPAPAADAMKPFQPLQSFRGEKVAFSGKLPTMTRAEAIKEVEKRGGSGFQRIGARCTVLVVGQDAHETTLQKARSWNIPTITWEEWFNRAEISWKRRKYAQAMGWL